MLSIALEWDIWNKIKKQWTPWIIRNIGKDSRGINHKWLRVLQLSPSI